MRCLPPLRSARPGAATGLEVPGRCDTSRTWTIIDGSGMTSARLSLTWDVAWRENLRSTIRPHTEVFVACLLQRCGADIPRGAIASG
jgi:hypothetical protein